MHSHFVNYIRFKLEKMIKFYAFIKSAVWIPAFAGMTKLQLVMTVQFMRIAKK